MAEAVIECSKFAMVCFFRVAHVHQVHVLYGEMFDPVYLMVPTQALKLGRSAGQIRQAS